MGRKWNNIKMKKAAADKAKSLSYTKVLNEITMAVKNAGADVDSNFGLKLALQKAKTANVPKDNIAKAIAKGEGSDQSDWKEVNYEGYGPEGVAIFVEAATDNPTRTIGNIRSYFNKIGGSLGKEGCLQFVFDRKSVFTLKDNNIDIDELTLELIDAGAEEVEKEEGFITIEGPTQNFGDLYKKLEEMKIELEEFGLERIPQTTKSVSTKENYDIVLRIIDLCENDDDVQKVYHNLEFSEEFND